MDEERSPRKIVDWCPPGRRKKGKPRKSWIQEVTTVMREKGVNNIECIDREECTRRIKEALQLGGKY